MKPTIRTLLVANRGEIACRVFRTCRALGITTVAVHSDPDADALHVREADLAVRLPGATPADTYLRADLLVRAAVAAGADAVHPGYGFLSENADFARAVADTGLTWVGPAPEAIDAMASKTRAKKLMATAGVPLLAPVDPDRATEADLPLLIKAAAGGGGRGMRIVRALGELPGELAAARAEAEKAFGDGEVFVEPYLERGRHVEVQILGDTHGTVWALGTRDCSLQRRHQKVIEEAPAPGLDAALHDGLLDAATAAARAIGYTGAGTVEFLVREGRAHFLEMNTRLQVEHPVTEAIHGIDLVALQLRVAEGHALDKEPPPATGHAVEARLYAEDPSHGWAPQTGTLHRLTAPEGAHAGPGHPAARQGVRIDAGYADGDRIGVHYDAMLAKVIAHAPTRDEAVRALAGALGRTRLHGPVTNRDLLVRSLRHPEFTSPDRLDTGFYTRHLTELTRPVPTAEHDERLAAVAAALASAAGAPAGPGPAVGAWRNLPSQPRTRGYQGLLATHDIHYRTTRTTPVIVHALSGPDSPAAPATSFTPDTRSAPHVAPAPAPGIASASASAGPSFLHTPEPRVVTVRNQSVTLETDGVRREFQVFAYEDRIFVDTSTGSHAFTALPRFPEAITHREPGSLLAPMPGTVLRIAEGLAVGDRVEAGRTLVWLEAMKMEHRVNAPASGTLTALHAVPGQQVEVGALLAVVQETSAHEAPADDRPEDQETPQP
ncbi:acetyl/propionyl/methylcrotonyl-CoA carboxylase subunit alpha [Streptomyces tsukubensis]|uniref:acetyl/propionyl/methylcrotonyl-CoA carboxylase subunit alpha n=3 Tax=Streptomyces tsukubensis TaxID=83656 RepID=UPI001D038F58|nr:biotin carboxylase N-terminal domain-containing protein [Streptomyces tsukubensis]